MAASELIAAARAYAGLRPDSVRRAFEHAFYARMLPRLLEGAGGGAVVDLGCGDGLASALAGQRLERYVGVDLCPPPAPDRASRRFIAHDLRDGLGPVGRDPYDLYLATFGLASHLQPPELERLLREIADHGRPGAVVALEALGLYSLEWPGLWATRPGSGRVLPYRLGAEVTVHPWSPPELAALFERTGIAWLGALDRTLQAGPKTGRWGYWLGLPPLRQALNAMLGGDPVGGRLAGAPLPPLPEGRAAGVHRALAAARRAVLAARFDLEPRALARAVWALEPRTGGGYGHGLLALGRLT